MAVPTLAPLRKAQSRQPEAAMALLWIVDQFCLQRDVAAEIPAEVARAHDQESAFSPSSGAARGLPDQLSTVISQTN
ncbi:hypothetical protein ACQR1V_20230 [Bradyrhizobium oligotrophicum]|uniref:hypothetical protein n=1 Tax=Bradyrhizobium oligotrophicum TaxID=44255 RepID=UPI003EB82543